MASVTAYVPHIVSHWYFVLLALLAFLVVFDPTIPVRLSRGSIMASIRMQHERNATLHVDNRSSW